MTKQNFSKLILLILVLGFIISWVLFIPIKLVPIKAAYFNVESPFKIIESRHNSGEVFKVFSKIPTKWILNRSNYTITLVQGDRWYPELLAVAKDNKQNNISIKSDYVILLKQPHISSIQTNYQGEKVEYWIKASTIYGYDIQNPRLDKKEIKIELKITAMLSRATTKLNREAPQCFLVSA